MAKQVVVKLVHKGKPDIEVLITAGLTSGKQLRRALKVSPGMLYAMDIRGHVMIEDGCIDDDCPVVVREGRCFYEMSSADAN